MADKLIFPIGFDLESGIKAAEGKADNLLRQLEHRMNQHPLQIKVEMDGSKFAMFSRQFSNNIDGISNKIAQANRLWNEMRFDVKFDADGNLSRRAQVVFDAFKQLIGASETMGQRLNQVNRQLQQSEAETTRLITAEYDKRKRQIDQQIRDKERQAAAEERVRQSQLKGVNVGYVDLQKQTEAVRNLRLQYEAILPMLNAMAQKRVNIKIGIDRQFEADINRINAEIARLRQYNLQLGAKGDTNAIQANVAAIRQLEAELQRISQQKIDLLNTNKINGDLSRLRTEIASVFGELQTAERKLASDNSLNAALDAQSQKVLNLHAQIQKLDQQIAQLNAQGKMYNADGSFSIQATAVLQQRIALTKELEQAVVTGQQAQIKLEQQLREEKRRTDQEAKQAAKAEATARKQAIEAANAENKARQAAYNARRKQGLETQRILQKEAKSIADITAQLQIQQQRLNTANVGSAKFNKIAEEVKRLTAELDKANQKMRELTGQTTSGASKQASSVNKVSQEFKKQDTYVLRLIKRLAVYAGFQQISSFLTNVREVTAQFELQRVSLGAILQDQTKANQLFSEIKQFALKSPVKILDLAKYTKQLAAYKIGYDELFETTKKLTDVSVGLGVSMDRVVLAYGQVRATGYLRASEIRQFTEMGVPIVEELASKLTKMNGELVTAAQVMDMVSKRGISFELVKEVFDDLTSAGGAFYNMQEKQGNTLYGMWAKLGDAASVMYEQIGNTGWVNSSMKGMINSLTDLMRNWKEVSRYIGVAGVALISYMLTSKLGTASTVMAAKATRDYTRAQVQLNTAKAQGSKMSVIAATASTRVAVANRAAAMATNVWTAATYRLIAATNSLKAALATNWVTLAITAILALANAIYTAWENSRRLGNALDDIKSEMTTLQTQSVRNFEYLANNAVKAANGSKEQREALDELNRTYKDILPQEALKLENLQKLNGQYDSLTKSVKEYIAVQQEEKAINTIGEEYGKQITQNEKLLRETFKKGFDMSDTDIDRFFVHFKKLSTDASLTLEQKVTKAFNNIGKKLTSSEKGDLFDTVLGIKTGTYAVLDDLNDAMVEQEERINAVRKEYKLAAGDLGEFGVKLEETKEKLANIKYTNPNGSPMDTDSLLYQQSVANDTMKAARDLIIDEVNELNEELKAEGKPIFKFLEGDWTHYVENVDPKNLMDITTINFDAILEAIGDKYPEFKMRIKAIQDEWGNVAPTNATAMQIRTKLVELSQSFDPALQKMKKYLWDGSGEVDAYLKRLKGQQEELKARLKEKQETLKNMSLISKWWNKFLGKDIQAEIDQMNKELAALDSFVPFVQGYVPEEKKDKKKSGGRKSDTRLQTLQEINQTLEKINKEYDDLQKKEGKTKALEDIKKQFKDTLEYTNKLGAKFGLHFDFPTEFKSLQQYRNEILKVMKTLKNLKGGEKAILEFQTMIDKADSDNLQKQIEKQLKQLADRISRTKTAKEFYDKILSQTGDIELAKSVTLSIYGNTGEDLFKQTVEQIKKVFKTGNNELDLTIEAQLDYAIDTENQRINYEWLQQIYDGYQDEIIEKNRSTAEKIISEGQKTAAANISTWEKELAKAKDYEQQRLDIIRQGAEERKRILESYDYTPKQKAEKVAQSEKQQQTKLADIDFKEFKEGDYYIQMFQDLGDTATGSLKRMRDEIQRVIDTDRNMSPENMKTMVEALGKINDELEGRNPFGEMVSSMKGMFDAVNKVKQARAALAAAETEYKAQEPSLDLGIELAENNRIAAQMELDALKQNELATDNQIVAAEKKLQDATSQVLMAENKKTVAKGKVKKAQQDVNKAEDTAKKKQTQFINAVNKTGEAVDAVKGLLESLEPILGDLTEDGTTLGNAFAAMTTALTVFQSIMQIVIILQEAFNIATESNPWMAIAAAVLAVVAALASFVGAQKVAKANKEIERQQELLDQLEYTYGRLEKAAEKVFGADYVSNYNAQLKNLQAQAAAYRAQAEAERSKGKSKDKDKIKEYEEAYRDTMDEIADMQSQVAEQMLGTDLASAARDFAQAWIDAYKEFSSTSDAMSEKFREMIENMVVESAMAKVMERALKPMFDMIDNMSEQDFYSESFWKQVVAKAEQGTKDADAGAQTMMRFLEQAGINLRETGSELTGMSRDIAGTSEESINGLAVGINTQNYYVSQILSEVRMIREGRVGELTPMLTSVDYTPLIQQSLENQAMLVRNTAEAVVECRRSAVAAEMMLAEIRRVIVPRQTTPTHVMAVTLK